MPIPGVAALLAPAAAICPALPSVVQTGQHLADGTRMAQTLFGIVFMSYVTSLPALVARNTALRPGALGAVPGGNTLSASVLFIVNIAGGTGALRVPRDCAARRHGLAATVVTGAILQVILSPRGRQIRGVWPDAVAIPITVAAGTGVVYVAK